LNNRIAFEQAQRFAERLRKEFGNEPEIQATGAWRIALGRPASAREQEEAAALIHKAGLEKFCLTLFNLNEFAFVD
jgi:hypothetical protein